jgi:phosphate starvation-inducible PhoH-like protein
MSRRNRDNKEIQRSTRRGSNYSSFEEPTDYSRETMPAYVPIQAKPIVPKNRNQEEYIHAIRTAQITFGIGPAGTGKTFLATAVAAEELLDKSVTKLILTRPAVEAGEDMGFLPGEIAEKFGPYLTPYKEILIKRLNKGFMEYAIRHDKIEASPVGYMRGRTFEDTIVLVDEAQNLTAEQLKMLMTRIGSNCRMIINGDPAQSDIGSKSGLMDAVRRVKWIPQVAVVTFTVEDIVRSGIVSDIVQSYE